MKSTRQRGMKTTKEEESMIDDVLEFYGKSYKEMVLGWFLEKWEAIQTQKTKHKKE